MEKAFCSYSENSLSVFLILSCISSSSLLTASYSTERLSSCFLRPESFFFSAFNLSSSGFNRSFFICWISLPSTFSFWYSFKSAWSITLISSLFSKLLPCFLASATFTKAVLSILSLVIFTSMPLSSKVEFIKFRSRYNRLPIEAYLPWMLTSILWVLVYPQALWIAPITVENGGSGYVILFSYVSGLR